MYDYLAQAWPHYKFPKHFQKNCGRTNTQIHSSFSAPRSTDRGEWAIPSFHYVYAQTEFILIDSKPNKFGCTFRLQCAVLPPARLCGFQIRERIAYLNVKHFPGQTFRLKGIAQW